MPWVSHQGKTEVCAPGRICHLQPTLWDWRWGRMPETVRARLQDVTATKSASLADSMDRQAINLTESLQSFKKANNLRIAFLGMFCDQEHGLHIGSCFWSRIFRQFWMQLFDIPVGVNYAPVLANFHILIIWDWVFWNASLVLILVQFFFVSYAYRVWRCYFYFLISFNSPMSCIWTKSLLALTHKYHTKLLIKN